jgi:peptide/nickel transport system ATP-binding protein
MSKDAMIEIKDIYVNFYTQAGIVKALDGINLTIYEGETLGLVGETGCGKSVTANTVMRLIPQPPGRIEKGQIYFMKPPANDESIKAMEETKAGYLESHPGIAKEDPQLLRIEKDLQELIRRKQVREELESLHGSNISPDDQRVKDLKAELIKLEARYDLLMRGKDYMQKIRGKYISMIFQEPMSALNPVYRVGDQISEVLLLHEKKSLCESALDKIEADIKNTNGYTKVSRVKNNKNEDICSKCGTVLTEDALACPYCGGSLHRRMSRMAGFEYRMYRGLYKKMAKNPDRRVYRWMARIPLVRRFELPMKAEAMDRAERMLRLVRIPDPDYVVTSYPHELSGGMQQRVMIAMALACKPHLLVADEPTTALDVTIQAQILKLMKELQEETGTSILMITHNLGVVAEICDRVGVMYAGTIAEIGTNREIFKEPLHPYTQGLMNSIPRVNIDMGRLETIEGNVPNLVKPPTGCRFHPRCPYAMQNCKASKPELTEIRPGHFVACFLYTGVK